MTNPVKNAARPKIRKNRTRIRFLTTVEVDELVHTPFPKDAWGRIEPTLYLTAAMTGLRQGELLALRWHDVDFKASRIRVVPNYVRGEFNDPKSEESSRSVPMSSKVGRALADLQKSSKFAKPGDLVFCHPDTGNPIDRSKLIRRLKQALDHAKLERGHLRGNCDHALSTQWPRLGYLAAQFKSGSGMKRGTEVYMHYAPREDEVDIVDRAFA